MEQFATETMGDTASYKLWRETDNPCKRCSHIVEVKSVSNMPKTTPTKDTLF